jgi:ferritin
MKIIEKLSEKISEEIRDAQCYAKMALENRDQYPDLSRTLYELSTEEMGHMAKLHGAVADIIENYRKTNGEPPANMLAVYDYLHKQQIEKAAKVKTLQAMFKEN